MYASETIVKRSKLLPYKSKHIQVIPGLKRFKDYYLIGTV